MSEKRSYYDKNGNYIGYSSNNPQYEWLGGTIFLIMLAITFRKVTLIIIGIGIAIFLAIYIINMTMKLKRRREEKTVRKLEMMKEMILIPAGEFQMGSNDGSSDEEPIHTVYLDGFYVDKYPVTNAQYMRFIDATGYKAPSYWNNYVNPFGPRYIGYYNAPKNIDKTLWFGHSLGIWEETHTEAPNQPVVCINWEDAKAYANWAGKRLPTEAEWEKVARGGLVGKKYPWGDSLTHNDANYIGTGSKDIWTYLSPVGSFVSNGYGLYDIAGNVWEWCADWYDKNYYKDSPKHNPKGPDSGSNKVLRGGSWNSDDIRVSNRNFGDPTHEHIDVGFRCVMDVLKQYK